MITEIVSAAATAKALSLWNVSGNDAPPDGWAALAFDDSAWPDGVAASFLTGFGPPAGLGAVWSSSSPLNDSEQCLTRHVFALPAGAITDAELLVKGDDSCYEVRVNGTLVTSTLPPADDGDPLISSTVAVSAGLLNRGGNNVIAIWGKNVYRAKAWVAWKLTVTSSDTAASLAFKLVIS